MIKRIIHKLKHRHFCKLIQRKPITNYDRIISKTPEELAEWLEAHCYQYGWLDWLKQEAKE